jgi:hypothetical protein
MAIDRSVNIAKQGTKEKPHTVGRGRKGRYLRPGSTILLRKNPLPDLDGVILI